MSTEKDWWRAWRWRLRLAWSALCGRDLAAYYFPPSNGAAYGFGAPLDDGPPAQHGPYGRCVFSRDVRLAAGTVRISTYGPRGDRCPNFPVVISFANRRAPILLSHLDAPEFGQGVLDAAQQIRVRMAL